MADDIGALLRDAAQLPIYRVLQRVYERASGGRNNWEKTECYPLGPLRTSLTLPNGWTSADLKISMDLVRYLGIHLGTAANVEAQWIPPTRRAPANGKDLTTRMQQRLAQWQTLGVGSTYAGRNLIIKNSVLAKAWYMAELQSVPHLDAIIHKWQRFTWHFIEGAARPTHDDAPTAHHVTRAVLVQDYPEGGRRCLDVALFVRALRLRAESAASSSQAATLFKQSPTIGYAAHTRLFPTIPRPFSLATAQ